MEHTLELKGKVPSKKNSKRRIKRGNNIFMVPSAAHEVWHEEQMYALRRLWPRNLLLSSIKRAELTFYAGDRRKADLSNKTESVMDLLVDAGVIEDDNWFVAPEMLLKFGGVDKENPRVIIKLT